MIDQGPTALVTGATGLVGSHVVERLLADGWGVRALVRDPARAAWLSALGVELARGDVLDAASFAAAARGRDAIFHTAAMIVAGGSWETFRRTNVDGTRNAIDAAESSGARLMHVSSVAVYGSEARYREAPTDEATPLAPLAETAYYARSKRESEEMVMAAHRAGRIWATAVRPDVIYGRRDRQFVPRAAVLLKLGVMPLVAGGRSTLAIVHAANVADGAVRAVATDAAGGNAYNVANDYDVTVRDFVRLAGEGLGRRIRTIPISMGVARAAMGVVKVGVLLAKGPAMAAHSGSTLNMVTKNNPFSSERARRELGWDPPVRPETGIPEAFRWWREHGG